MSTHWKRRACLSLAALLLALGFTTSSRAMNEEHGDKSSCSCWQFFKKLKAQSTNYGKNHILCLADSEVAQLRQGIVTPSVKDLWKRRDQQTATDEGKYSFFLCSESNQEKFGIDSSTGADGAPHKWVLKKYETGQKSAAAKYDGSLKKMFGSSVFESEERFEVFDIRPNEKRLNEAAQEQSQESRKRGNPTTLQKTLAEVKKELKEEDFLDLTRREGTLTVTTYGGTINHWGDGTKNKSGYTTN